MRDYLDTDEKKNSGSSSGTVSGPTGFSLHSARKAHPNRLPALNMAAPVETSSSSRSSASSTTGTVELTSDWVVTFESPHGESETIKGEETPGINVKASRRRGRRGGGGRMAQYVQHYVMVYDNTCKQVLMKNKVHTAGSQQHLLYYTKDKPGAPTTNHNRGFSGRHSPCSFCQQPLDEYYWVNFHVQHNPNFFMCTNCCDELLQIQGVTIIYEADKKLSAAAKADELEEAQLRQARRKAVEDTDHSILDEKKEPTVDYETGVKYLKHLHSLREFHLNFLLELFRRLGLEDTPLRVPVVHNPDGSLEEITDQDFLNSSPWLQTKAMNLVVFKLPWKAAEGQDYFFLRFRNVLFEQANAESILFNQQAMQIAATPGGGGAQTLQMPILPVAWGATTLLILPNWIDQVDHSVFSNIYGLATQPPNFSIPVLPQCQEDPSFPLGKHIRVIQLPNSPTVIHTLTDQVDSTSLTFQQQITNLGLDDLKLSFSCFVMTYISGSCPVTVDCSSLKGLNNVNLSRLDQFLLPERQFMSVDALPDSPFACPWSLQLFQCSYDWYTLSTQVQTQMMTHGVSRVSCSDYPDLAEVLRSSPLSEALSDIFPNYASPIWRNTGKLIDQNLQALSGRITKVPKFGFLGDHQMTTFDLRATMPGLLVIEDGVLMMAAKLTSVILGGESLTKIGDGVLSACKQLISIDCSDAKKLVEIGTNFARDCPSLRRFNFPVQGESLKKVGGGFLCGCPSLKRVDFSSVPNVSPIGFWCVSLQPKQKTYSQQQQIQQGLYVDPIIHPDLSTCVSGSAAMSVLDISCLRTNQFDLSYPNSHLVDPAAVFTGRGGRGGRGGGGRGGIPGMGGRKGQYVDWEARLQRQGTTLRFSVEQQDNIVKMRKKSTAGTVEWEGSPTSQPRRGGGRGGFGGGRGAAAMMTGSGGFGFGQVDPSYSEDYYEEEEEDY